jgi:hypothetical protein
VRASEVHAAGGCARVPERVRSLNADSGKVGAAQGVLQGLARSACSAWMS